MKMKDEIIVLCGFSASGKDSIANILRENGYNFVVSTTTRPMRDNESQGSPYVFCDDKHFDLLIKDDKLIEHRKYYTLVNGKASIWHYGVTKDAIKDNAPYVVVLDILGLREFKKHFGDRVISFFLSTDEPTRRQRCINRKDFNATEWERRYQDDLTQFTDEVINGEVDYIVQSYDIRETKNAIFSILFSDRQQVMPKHKLLD